VVNLVDKILPRNWHIGLNLIESHGLIGKGVILSFGFAGSKFKDCRAIYSSFQ